MEATITEMVDAIKRNPNVTFDEVYNSSKKTNDIIGDRFKTAEHTKIFNPLFSIHETINSSNLSPENDSLKDHFEKFIEGHDTNIYYNSIIDSFKDTDDAFIGELPDSIKKNYVMDYVIESNKLSIDMNRLIEIGETRASTKEVQDKINATLAEQAKLKAEAEKAGVVPEIPIEPEFRIPTTIKLPFNGVEHQIEAPSILDRLTNPEELEIARKEIGKTWLSFIKEQGENIFVDEETGELMLNDITEEYFVKDLMDTAFRTKIDTTTRMQIIELDSNSDLASYEIKNNFINIEEGKGCSF